MIQITEKSKLLILSNSFDGTSDTLVGLCANQGVDVFRWNLDLWQNYEISADSNGYRIEDQYGRYIESSDPELIAIWRKPFVRITNRNSDDIKEDFAREQLRVYLRTLTQYLASTRKLRLVNPFLEMSFSKLIQLKLAEGFFKVPSWEFRTKNFKQSKDKKIVKPIGYPMLSNGKSVFTNLLFPTELEEPYPWLFQEALIQGCDVTCVFIDGNCFWYKSNFKRSSNSVDWRREIQTENESPWVKMPEKNMAEYTLKVREFMSSARLKYGRLDFILDNDGNLWFLECNVNGEFGWLDGEDETLHKAFLRAIVDSNNFISG